MNGPRDSVEAQLLDIWRNALPVDSVQDDFFDLGGDSLQAVGIIGEIRKRLGVEIDISEFMTSPTVAALAVAVRLGRAQRRSSASLVPLRVAQDSARLFVVHSVSGTVMRYVPLARALSPRWSVWGLQSRGLDRDEPLHSSIEEMAGAYIQEMRAVHRDAPWNVLGYCMGGVVAYEVARQLEAAGDVVRSVVLVDPPPPSVMPARPRAEIRKSHLHSLARDVLKVDIDYESLSALPQDQQHDELLRLGAEAGTIPQDYDRDSIRRMLDVRIHNRVVSTDYLPGTYGGRVTLIRAYPSTASMVPEATGHLGWAALARLVDVEAMVCAHQDVMAPAFVGKVAEVVESSAYEVAS